MDQCLYMWGANLPLAEAKLQPRVAGGQDGAETLIGLRHMGQQLVPHPGVEVLPELIVWGVGKTWTPMGG